MIFTIFMYFSGTINFAIEDHERTYFFSSFMTSSDRIVYNPIMFIMSIVRQLPLYTPHLVQHRFGEILV